VGEKKLFCVFGRRERWVCERRISLLCMKKCSWKKMVCKQKNMEESYV
jgi:hypothetical protein